MTDLPWSELQDPRRSSLGRRIRRRRRFDGRCPGLSRTMLRLALLENLRRLGDQIMATIASRAMRRCAARGSLCTSGAAALAPAERCVFIVSLADGLRATTSRSRGRPP
jgi:hypothetical protein